jgi:HPt (histidine-containing phosphotransfer) domain-containing protein
MSGAINTEVSARIELLRQQFVLRMMSDASSIQSCFDGWDARPLTDAEIGSLRKICHSLCGAAGVFGYPSVADAASRMSTALTAGERHGARLTILARCFWNSKTPPPHPCSKSRGRLRCVSRLDCRGGRRRRRDV